MAALLVRPGHQAGWGRGKTEENPSNGVIKGPRQIAMYCIGREVEGSVDLLGLGGAMAEYPFARCLHVAPRFPPHGRTKE
jgi:hypothetical protein